MSDWPLVYLAFLVVLIVPFMVLHFLLARRDRAETALRAKWRQELTRERTLRELAEDEVRLRDEWYQHLLNNTSDMVLVFGLTPDGNPGHFLEVNDTACRQLGYPRERLLALTPAELEDWQASGLLLSAGWTNLATVTDDELRQRAATFSRVLVTQILEKKDLVFERTYVTANGQRMPVEIKARRFDLRGKPLIMFTAQDISERKASEQALQDSERRFQEFFQQSSVGVATYDTQRVLLNVNPACLRMFGVPGREEFGRLSPFDNPAMPDTARKALARGESAHYEMMWDFSSTASRQLLASTRSGKAYMDVLINPLGRDADANTRGYLVQFLDVTARRESELALREIEGHLQQAQKMQALGTMAGGIAHDFNNILTPILGYAEMAVRVVPEGQSLHLYLQEIVRASHRARELVTQILSFSRQTVPEGRPIPVAPIIKEVAKLLRASAPQNVDIQVVIKTERNTVVADPTQIHQVLMNLCTNGLHAMRETGGVLEIRVTDFLHSARPRSEFPQLPPGRYVRLSVKDTGCGIPREIRNRIFEPFFTTKQRGEGTGMGLAVVHGIITALKGTVTVESEGGKGSVFHVVLPAVEQEGITHTEAEEPLPTGAGRILFVDDDEEVLKLGEEMLRTLGYEPIIARHGNAALCILNLDPPRVDLIVTDLMMPGLDGKQLAREARAVRADIPIILCTGFSEVPSEAELRDLRIDGLIMKPILLRELAEKLHEILAAKQA